MLILTWKGNQTSYTTLTAFIEVRLQGPFQPQPFQDSVYFSSKEHILCRISSHI